MRLEHPEPPERLPLQLVSASRQDHVAREVVIDNANRIAIVTLEPATDSAHPGVVHKRREDAELI